MDALRGETGKKAAHSSTRQNYACLDGRSIQHFFLLFLHHFGLPFSSPQHSGIYLGICLSTSTQQKAGPFPPKHIPE
jgi:hypothetical protein